MLTWNFLLCIWQKQKVLKKHRLVLSFYYVPIQKLEFLKSNSMIKCSAYEHDSNFLFSIYHITDKNQILFSAVWREQFFTCSFHTLGERRGAHGVLVGKPEGKRPLRDPGVDGRMILRWIFRKQNGRGGHGLDLSGSAYRQVAGICECGNEPSGSIKYGEVLDLLRTG